MILALVWGCAVPPDRTPAHAVTALIVTVPDTALDDWLGEVLALAKRGELTLDQVASIEHETLRAYEDGTITAEERYHLESLTSVPIRHHLFIADRVAHRSRLDQPRKDAIGALERLGFQVTCRESERGERCSGHRDDGERLEMWVREPRWRGSEEHTWDDRPWGPHCADAWLSQGVVVRYEFFSAPTETADPAQPGERWEPDGTWLVDGERRVPVERSPVAGCRWWTP